MPLTKQQPGSLLWGMADTGLRGKVEDYKAYILSLLFFKRLSDNYFSIAWKNRKKLFHSVENCAPPGWSRFFQSFLTSVFTGRVGVCDG